jgi:hypothetical protein
MPTKTLWRPGEPPALGEGGPAPAGSVSWVDLEPELTDPARLLETLAKDCPGLDREMAADLVSGELNPEGRSYLDGRVRLVTAVDIQTETIGPADNRRRCVVIQPVDILASEGWMVTRWEPRRVFMNGERLDDLAAEPPAEVIAGVSRRWQGGTGRGAGDLGVLLMHELALRYAPAHRNLYHWLEEWELGLYGEGGEREVDPEALRGLWRSMALMRDWISPLNKIGMREDIGLAWLPATDATEVNEVDDRIDRALSSLRELAATMRSSFALLHSQLEEEAHDRTDRLQRQLGYLATLLLIPTLVVGFYGANTYVPGQGQRSGLYVMAVVIVVLTILGLIAFRGWQRRADRR